MIVSASCRHSGQPVLTNTTTYNYRSTILAQAAGVPTLPWSGSSVAVSFEECGGDIPADAYDKACIHSLDDALACCRRIGYPIMLKASWGGGGKGIRKVRGQSASQLCMLLNSSTHSIDSAG